MDLDQLISLTVAEPPVAIQRASDADIGTLVGQLVSRLESSPALETQLHSLNELSLLAATNPGPLLVCLPSVYRILSSPATSPTILLASFSFLKSLFAPSAKDQEEDVKQRRNAKLSFLQESTHGLSLALAQSAQAQNSATTPALSVLVWLLTDSESMSLITKILQHKLQTPSFSVETSLAEHLVQLLRSANSDGFTVIDSILAIPEAMDGQANLVASCIRAGMLEQALKNIEADKVTTPRAISSMHILTKTINLATNVSLSDATFSLSQEVIQRNVIGGLGDLVHACTYSIINDLANKKPFGDAVATVLSKALSLVKVLIFPGTKQAILDSKVFAYSLMLICSPADTDFAHKDIQLVSLDAARLILQLIEADQVASQKMANTVVLSLQPGVPMRSIDVITRLTHILTALGDSVDPEFYKFVLHLLLETLQHRDLVSGCLNSVTNPLFSLYKASWTDGFKLLARTLGLKPPEDILGKASKEQAYIRLFAYVQEAQKSYRSAVVQLLGKGDHGFKSSVSKQSCLNMMQCMANNGSPLTVLAASAICLLNIIANDSRNGQCLAFSTLSYPKTIYDVIPTFVGALFGAAARVLPDHHSAVTVLTLLIALQDVLKSNSFFAFVSLFYSSDPAELVRNLSTFIAASLKADTPILIRLMTASIVASMPIDFYTAVSPLLVETSNTGEALRAALNAALIQGKTAELPESRVLRPYLTTLKNNVDALINALNTLPLTQQTATSAAITTTAATTTATIVPALPAAPVLNPNPATLPQHPVSIAKATATLTNNYTQTDLSVDSLIVEQALMREEIIRLREENAALVQKLSTQHQHQPFHSNQYAYASANPALIFESQTFDIAPTNATDNTIDESATLAVVKSEPVISATEESDHLEERLESEIPNVEVPDCLQPLTDATATSNPEDFYDKIDSQNSPITNTPIEQNVEILTSNISLANAEPGPSTQLCSDLYAPLSQDVSDPVSLPLPDDSQPVPDVPPITGNPPVPMVPINIPAPTTGVIGGRRPGRGNIRPRYATGLSEDARKNIATEEQNQQSF